MCFKEPTGSFLISVFFFCFSFFFPSLLAVKREEAACMKHCGRRSTAPSACGPLEAPGIFRFD